MDPVHRHLLLALMLGMLIHGVADEAAEAGLQLNPTVKVTSFGSRLPDDPLYPERSKVELLARLRLDLRYPQSEYATWHLAYEQRGRWRSSDSSGALTQLLPGEALPAWRLSPFDWRIDGGRDWHYRHEIDRANLTLRPAWGELTIGRQAIGLGRGVLFSAVDLFAPFSPVEVDREWRRGVDAARAEYRFTSTTSGELLAVGGESLNESAVLARLRGYLGNTDAEVLVGRRAEDELVGIVASRALGGAEVHGEVAAFRVPDPPHDGTWLPSDDLVTKALFGSSYTFDVGLGLTLLAEYHYSEFGLKEPTEAPLRLATDGDFRRRYLRGDTQILGRHAVGTQLSTPFSETWTGSLTVLQSRDGSGLAMPGLRWDATRTLTALITLYIPWGAGPEDGRLRSEYGASPHSIFFQLTAYF